jgi:hypothetical protein
MDCKETLTGMAKRLVIASALLLACAVPAGATTLQVSATQLFGIADTALKRGDDETARRVLRALMQDPSVEIRMEARFRLASVESKSGNLGSAATLLREIVDQRPTAAPARLELAQVLDRMGDKDGAWRQMRAIQAAGLPASVARLIDRYSQALRAQRPFGASFELAIAPDSNINRATRSDTLGTIFGDFQIADDGKAKSGTGLSINAQAYRRIAIGSEASMLIRSSGFANLYRRSEFNDLAADLAVGPDLYLGRDRLQLEVGATQRWFGQKPFMRSARLAGTWSHPLGSRTLLRFAGSAALVDNQLNDLQDGRTYSGQASIERALSPTTGVVASVGVDRQALRDPGYSTIGWRGSLNLWRDVGRMTISGGFDIGRLHADERLILFPERRSDRFTRFSIGATFRQVQWHGFSPLFRLSLERNRSTVAFYDYRRTRTEMGIVRAF